MDGPFDGAEFDRWRQEAQRAFTGAEALAEAGILNWACFACEQAAQLAIKGILHGFGAGAWGHDLPSLGKRAVDFGLQVPDDVTAALLRLGRHYIPARYPDAHPTGPASDHYGPEDWTQARSDTDLVLRFVDDVAAG